MEFGYLYHCPVSVFCFFFLYCGLHVVLISARNENMDLLISLNLQHTNMIVYSSLSIKLTFHIPVSWRLWCGDGENFNWREGFVKPCHEYTLEKIHTYGCFIDQWLGYWLISCVEKCIATLTARKKIIEWKGKIFWSGGRGWNFCLMLISLCSRMYYLIRVAWWLSVRFPVLMLLIKKYGMADKYVFCAGDWSWGSRTTTNNRSAILFLHRLLW